jgi:hypothetical protein
MPSAEEVHRFAVARDRLDEARANYRPIFDAAEYSELEASSEYWDLERRFLEAVDEFRSASEAMFPPSLPE